jgi:hypothetical protein
MTDDEVSELTTRTDVSAASPLRCARNYGDGADDLPTRLIPSVRLLPGVLI